jgi:hypothetical protein
MTMGGRLAVLMAKGHRDRRAELDLLREGGRYREGQEGIKLTPAVPGSSF